MILITCKKRLSFTVNSTLNSVQILALTNLGVKKVGATRSAIPTAESRFFASPTNILAMVLGVCMPCSLELISRRFTEYGNRNPCGSLAKCVADLK